MTTEVLGTAWVPTDDAFGARLALIRQRMGWGNVKEAAVECGLPPETWRTWERDGAMPRRVVEVAKLISGRTGCSYLWLLTGNATGSATGAPTVPKFAATGRVISRPPNRAGHDTRDGRRPEILRQAA